MRLFRDRALTNLVKTGRQVLTSSKPPHIHDISRIGSAGGFVKIDLECFVYTVGISARFREEWRKDEHFRTLFFFYFFFF